MGVAVVAALVAAVLYAVAGAFQHRSTTDVSHRGRGGRVGIIPFVIRTLHHPSWLIGTGVEVMGWALHTLALHRGPLALVQPLMVIGVVFALPLRDRMDHRRPERVELVWAGVLTLGLAAFLLVAPPRRLRPNQPTTARLAVSVLVGVGHRLLRLPRTGRQRLAAWEWPRAWRSPPPAALTKSVSNILITRHGTWSAPRRSICWWWSGPAGCSSTGWLFRPGPYGPASRRSAPSTR